MAKAKKKAKKAKNCAGLKKGKKGRMVLRKGYKYAKRGCPVKVAKKKK